MHLCRHVLLSAVALAVLAAPAQAISPQNPYRTFNLSGINYGSMQWERDQRAGRRVWPYYNTPTRTTTRNSGVWIGGVAGGGSPRPITSIVSGLIPPMITPWCATPVTRTRSPGCTTGFVPPKMNVTPVSSAKNVDRPGS